MTARPDRLDTILRAWLDEGLDAAPERAVTAALTRVTHTRQRRELAALRRIPLMDVTNARPRPAWQVGALVAVATVALMAAVVAMAQLLPQVGSSQRGPTVGEIVVGLPVPPDAHQTGRVAGRDVPLALFGATQVRTFANISGFADAAAITYSGISSPSRYVAAAISFPSTSAASGALADLEAGATGAPMTWLEGPFAELPADVDGFVRGGSYSATVGPQARAGLLMVWHRDRTLFVAVGSDAETPADEASAGAIGDAVIALAEVLDRQSR